MKVDIEPSYNIHYSAVCETCDFSAAIFADGTTTQVVKLCTSHVEDTGHVVILESGSSFKFSKGCVKR